MFLKTLLLQLYLDKLANNIKSYSKKRGEVFIKIINN